MTQPRPEVKFRMSIGHPPLFEPLLLLFATAAWGCADGWWRRFEWAWPIASREMGLSALLCGTVMAYEKLLEKFEETKGDYAEYLA